MEERLNYLIDLLIEKDKVIAQLQKYYAETANSYDELKKATDGETISELKEEIHNLELRITNEDTKKLLDNIAEEQKHSVQEESDYYFETYNAAKDYLTRTYGNEANKLRTEHDVEAFFIRHGKKLIIKNND